MTIELTLIVQAINFFVAYLLLDVLLVRPAVSFILKEKEAFTALIQKTQREAALLKEYQESKEAQWKVCEEYFEMESPQGLPIDITWLTDGPSIVPEIPSHQELEKKEDRIVNALVKKMQL